MLPPFGAARPLTVISFSPSYAIVSETSALSANLPLASYAAATKVMFFDLRKCLFVLFVALNFTVFEAL